MFNAAENVQGPDCGVDGDGGLNNGVEELDDRDDGLGGAAEGEVVEYGIVAEGGERGGNIEKDSCNVLAVSFGREGGATVKHENLIRYRPTFQKPLLVVIDHRGCGGRQGSVNSGRYNLYSAFPRVFGLVRLGVLQNLLSTSSIVSSPLGMQMRSEKLKPIGMNLLSRKWVKAA